MDMVLEVRGLSKSFGAVRALQKVDLYLGRQEILGLVGDNAAGKSTLLKCLSGVYTPDEGEIYIEGKEVKISNPLFARSLGIEIIYQDLMLTPNLDVISNIFLGRELKTRGGLLGKLNNKKMREESQRVLEELNLDIGSLHSPVRHLSGGQQQGVAIARAIVYKPKIILMDEATANLSISAIETFLELVRQIREQWASSIIYVSHRLTDVLSISDRIMVLRRGEVAGVRGASETNLDEIIRMIMGLD